LPNTGSTAQHWFNQNEDLTKGYYSEGIFKVCQGLPGSARLYPRILGLFPQKSH